MFKATTSRKKIKISSEIIHPVCTGLPVFVQALNIENGIKIKRINTGKLKDAGMNEGFIITKIDNEKIYSLKDIKKALKSKKGGVLLEGLYADGTKAYFGFGL